MARRLTSAWWGVVLGVGLVVVPRAGWAQELLPPEPAAGGFRESWAEFFRQRTHVTFGVNELYKDNVFATRGASRQFDWKTTVEGEIAFADPRGDWLYGGSYEMKGFRHHTLNQSGATNELRGYLFYNPLARYRASLLLKRQRDEVLVVGTEENDVIRRFTHLTRVTTTEAQVKASYGLNPTTLLGGEYHATSYEDQAADSSNTRNIAHEVTLGVSRDLSPRWTMFGGLNLTETDYPKTTGKDVETRGIRLMNTYDLDPSTVATATVDFLQRLPEAGKNTFTENVELELARAVGPRSGWDILLERKTLPSAGSTGQSFENRAITLTWKHEVTPLISVKWEGFYGHVKTRTTQSDSWRSGLKLIWQIGPNVEGTMSYAYSLLSQQDIFSHTAMVGLEIQL